VAGRRADHALDHDLLVAEEVADPSQGRSLLVPAWALPEQVLDDGEPEFRETPSECRPDAVQRLDRLAEPVVSRRPAPSRPAFGRLEAGKRAELGACHRPHRTEPL